MNKIASLCLLLLGLALLGAGWEAYNSVSSDVSRLFTGGPSNRSLLLLAGGTLVSLAGLRGLTVSRG